MAAAFRLGSAKLRAERGEEGEEEHVVHGGRGSLTSAKLEHHGAMKELEDEATRAEEELLERLRKEEELARLTEDELRWLNLVQEDEAERQYREKVAKNEEEAKAKEAREEQEERVRTQEVSYPFSLPHCTPVHSPPAHLCLPHQPATRYHVRVAAASLFASPAEGSSSEDTARCCRRARGSDAAAASFHLFLSHSISFHLLIFFSSLSIFSSFFHRFPSFYLFALQERERLRAVWEDRELQTAAESSRAEEERREAEQMLELTRSFTPACTTPPPIQRHTAANTHSQLPTSSPANAACLQQPPLNLPPPTPRAIPLGPAG